MPDKTSQSSNSSSYQVTSSGTNSQGNHYCSRDYGPSADNQTSYHYSNTDGSHSYSNPDGSTYHNSGDGYANYTSASGGGYTESGGQKTTPKQLEVW